jgi:class 3 adenylate cyclase
MSSPGWRNSSMTSWSPVTLSFLYPDVSGGWGMPGHLPSGTVTFLLTDLEGSTRIWEQDPEAMKPAMVRHDEILEKTIAGNRGFVFSRMGDGMAVAFATAGDAVAAALAIKHALIDENWRSPSPLKARIGLHTAEAVIRRRQRICEPADQPLLTADVGRARRNGSDSATDRSSLEY